MSYDWNNILIRSQDSIRNALKTIDSEALRIALVVDEQMSLVGVVTDGDIRRGLLRNLSLDDQVSAVMNSTPLTIPVGYSRTEARKLMLSKGILAIPVVDDKRVVALETLHTFSQQRKYEHPVFLMAGGFGTRLRPLTDNCPKPLLKVGGKPILEILLQSFVRTGFVNFYISTHYLPEMIKDYFGDGSKWNINITYVHEESPLGTGGALGLLPKDLPDLPLIVINGDVLTNVDFERVLEFHAKHNAAATMCVRDYEYQVPFGVVQGLGNQITGMVEKPVYRFFVNAGIYVIGPELRQSVEKNQYIDMPSLLERSISAGKDVLMLPVHEYWLDIGRLDDFNKAQSDIHNLGLL